jgi:hypothetical protein
MYRNPGAWFGLKVTFSIVSYTVPVENCDKKVIPVLPPNVRVAHGRGVVVSAGRGVTSPQGLDGSSLGPPVLKRPSA